MGVRRANEIAENHARQFQVVDIIALTLGEANVLDAFALAAETFEFFGASGALGFNSLDGHCAASTNGVLGSQLRRRILDRLDDVHIAGAAAQVSGNAVTDFLLAGIGIFHQQARGAQDHARRAIAALQPMHQPKTFLDGGKRPVGVGDPFDGGDMGAIGLDREAHAALDRHVVHVDGAGAAMAGVAADMGSGEIELLAKEMNEQEARLDVGFDRLAVDGEGDVVF